MACGTTKDALTLDKIRRDAPFVFKMYGLADIDEAPFFAWNEDGTQLRIERPKMDEYLQSARSAFNLTSISLLEHLMIDFGFICTVGQNPNQKVVQYEHPNFRRDRQDLMYKIRRTKYTEFKEKITMINGVAFTEETLEIMKKQMEKAIGNAQLLNKLNMMPLEPEDLDEEKTYVEKPYRFNVNVEEAKKAFFQQCDGEQPQPEYPTEVEEDMNATKHDTNGNDTNSDDTNGGDTRTLSEIGMGNKTGVREGFLLSIPVSEGKEEQEEVDEKEEPDIQPANSEPDFPALAACLEALAVRNNENE